MNLKEKLEVTGLVPVVKLKSADSAVALAEALGKGGLKAAEITFRTDAAEESIRRIAKAYPDFLLAAGTVLNCENADRAMDAGAGLIVSPGLNPKVVEHCVKKGYPVMPGITSPSEIELAMSFGLDTVKFFPAEAMGGVKMLKALSAPYGNLKFMPTGGIDSNNLCSYLDLPCVLCCGGSWMVKGELIDSGNFDAITELTKDAVKSMLGLEMKKVVLNSEVEGTVKEFCNKLGLEFSKNEQSACFECNDVQRAVYYMEQEGFLIDPTGLEYDSKHRITKAVLKAQNTAICLVNKEKKK